MYKDIKPIIENTVMKARYNEKGEVINYVIAPKEGYKLHEKSRDEAVIDENGNLTGEIKKGYTTGIVTALSDYDFAENPREIYAVKE
jgi:hypothetical protein